MAQTWCTPFADVFDPGFSGSGCAPQPLNPWVDYGQTFFGRLNRNPQSASDVWQWALADKWNAQKGGFAGQSAQLANAGGGTVGTAAANTGPAASTAPSSPATSLPFWLVALLLFVVFILLGVRF